MTRDNILDFLKKHKDELSKRYGVTKLGLFGSYARGEQKEDSDIDIAVEIKSQNKFKSFFELKYYLEDNLKKRVDLGIEHTLKPIAKQYIEKEIIYV